MEVSQKLLGLMFTLSVTTGAGLGLILNLIGLIRALTGAKKTDPRPVQTAGKRALAAWYARRALRGIPDVLTFLIDVLFGILCGCALVLLLYYTNDGGFRLLAVIGMAAGVFAWHYTLGRPLTKLTDSAAARLRRIPGSIRAVRKKQKQRKAEAAYERANRT